MVAIESGLVCSVATGMRGLEGDFFIARRALRNDCFGGGAGAGKCSFFSVFLAKNFLGAWLILALELGRWLWDYARAGYRAAVRDVSIARYADGFCSNAGSGSAHAAREAVALRR